MLSQFHFLSIPIIMWSMGPGYAVRTVGLLLLVNSLGFPEQPEGTHGACGAGDPVSYRSNPNHSSCEAKRATVWEFCLFCFVLNFRHCSKTWAGFAHVIHPSQAHMLIFCRPSSRAKETEHWLEEQRTAKLCPTKPLMTIIQVL